MSHGEFPTSEGRNQCTGQFAQKAGKVFNPALAELKKDTDGLE